LSNIDDFEEIKQPISDNSESLSWEDWLINMTRPELLAQPKTLTPIPNTNNMLCDGALVLIFGLTGDGKSYMTNTMLKDVKGYEMLWLDGDNNPVHFVEKFPHMHHIPPMNSNWWLDELFKSKYDLSKKLIVIDAMKDFSMGHDIDNNSGSVDLMSKYNSLCNRGATVIVNMHVTASYTDPKKPTFKMKGNDQGLASSVDIVYKYSRDWAKDENTMIVEKSRQDDVNKGDKYITSRMVHVFEPLLHEQPIREDSESKETVVKKEVKGDEAWNRLIQ